jgi:hypothetical protein
MRHRIFLVVCLALVLGAATAASARAGATVKADAVKTVQTDTSTYYCRKVTVIRWQKTVLGRPAYRFIHFKRWCWTKPARDIFNITMGVRFDGQDPNFHWKGIVLRETNYFIWCCGDWNSGHHSRRQGRVENCVLKHGCVGSFFPWAQINSHRDGTFAIRSGGT